MEQDCDVENAPAVLETIVKSEPVDTDSDDDQVNNSQGHIHEQMSYSSSSFTELLKEPQDIIIKTEHEKTSSTMDLPCPPNLAPYTDQEIYSAFDHCYDPKKPSINVDNPASVFARVFTHLTSAKKSSVYEREYLHRLWMRKYKPLSLHKFTEEEFGTAFKLCYNVKSKLVFQMPTSIFGKVFTLLTGNKSSTLVERRYLYEIWRIKYKEDLAKNRMAFNGLAKTVREKVKRRLIRSNAVVETRTKQHVNTESSNIEEGKIPADLSASTLCGNNSETFPYKKITIRVKKEISSSEDEMDYDSADVASSPPPSTPPSSPPPTPPPSSPPSSPPPSSSSPESSQSDNLFDVNETRKEEDEKLILNPVTKLARLQQPEKRKPIISGDESTNENNLVLTRRKLMKTTPLKMKGTPRVNPPKVVTTRGRGRPRIHPRKIRKPRLHDSEMQKLANYDLCGVPPVHDNQVPLPLEIFYKSHAQHEFIVSGELLSKSNCCAELLEKTAPSVGKGTFANPCWTLVNNTIMCVCPGCGMTFKEIKKLLRHRNEKHRMYLGGCVICSKPFTLRGSVVTHVATHLNTAELQDLYEKEMSRLGPSIEPSCFRLYKCDRCCKVLVGSRRLEAHIDFVHEKTKRRITKKSQTKAVSAGTSFQCGCTICGNPLGPEYMILHNRTHLNLEEQKQFVMESREKINTENAAGITGNKKNRTDLRIEQLKKSLETLERRIPKQRTNPKLTSGRRNRRKDLQLANNNRARKNAKRDGNYGPVQCSVCGKVLATIYRLKSHEILKHEGGPENKIACSICGRQFGDKQCLLTHLRTHFNLEEQEKFAVWRGSILEFIERLNNGTDLEIPPSVKTRIRNHNKQFYRNRVRKPRGRPRKQQHHPFEKKDDYGGVSSGYGEGGKAEHDEYSGGGIQCEGNSSHSTESNTTAGVGYRGMEIGPMSSETLTSHPTALQWNSYINQGTSYFYQENNNN